VHGGGGHGHRPRLPIVVGAVDVVPDEAGAGGIELDGADVVGALEDADGVDGAQRQGRVGGVVGRPVGVATVGQGQGVDQAAAGDGGVAIIEQGGDSAIDVGLGLESVIFGNVINLVAEDQGRGVLWRCRTGRVLDGAIGVGQLDQGIGVHRRDRGAGQRRVL